MTKKRFSILLFLLAVLLGGLALFFSFGQNILRVESNFQTRYGVTFSTSYSKQLGLNVFETYRTLIDELGVRAVRLPVYWSEIEKIKGNFNWDELDQLVKYSEEKGTKLTLVVGTKVPRWPECYVPDWAEQLSVEALQSQVLEMITAVVNRYKTSSAVERWQAENEPFFPFGLCPALTLARFQERVDLIRQLDPSRPIQVTVSGELAPWEDEAKAADILGISMYRLTWNNLFGYFMYPLTPEYYYLRARTIQEKVPTVIVSELQAEPWFPEPISSRPLAKWYETFDQEAFRNNIRFVREAHLPEVYFWGAEWWYYLKQNGDERLWQVAKETFR